MKIYIYRVGESSDIIESGMIGKMNLVTTIIQLRGIMDMI